MLGTHVRSRDALNCPYALNKSADASRRAVCRAPTCAAVMHLVVSKP